MDTLKCVFCGEDILLCPCSDILNKAIKKLQGDVLKRRFLFCVINDPKAAITTAKGIIKKSHS